MQDLTKKLEGALIKAGSYERLISDYEAICTRDENTVSRNTKYANTLIQLLEIATRSKDVPYAILGGMAVLGNIMQTDEKAALNWRGTDDIDILAQSNVLENVLKELNYTRQRGNHYGKRGAEGTSSIVTYTLDGGESGIVQVRGDVILNDRDVTQKVIDSAISADMYGIPVKIMNDKYLIGTKREANRSKDREDIKELKNS